MGPRRDGAATARLGFLNQQRLVACVLEGAFAVGSHADDAAFGDGNHLAVNLIGAIAFEDDVEFLVGLVGVKKAAVLSRNEGLVGNLAACGLQCLSDKHLAFQGEIGTHGQFVVDDFVGLSHRHGSVVLAFLDGF